MSDIAIRVEELGKAYRIGLKEEIPDTAAAAVGSWLRKPLKNFQRLRRLNTFRSNGDADDIIWALKDVSFDVKQGEVLGVIGRNGAGKSTLLKILSRITEPTRGQATIHGRVSSLLEVGTGFHPELTGRENVYLNGTILGMSKREIDRKFDEIVDFSGVEKFLDTPVKRYSSGMRVRLAFSVAAHLDPEILMIDEVLAVGDAEFQKKCLGKMGQVATEGRTVLFVSHNMAAVQSLCGSVVLLRNGQLQSLGPVHKVVQSYFSEIEPNTGIFHTDYPNDPSKPMQLLAVSLEKPPTGTFRISDQLKFTVNVLSRATVDAAYITINIWDCYDSLVYWTSDIGSSRHGNPTTGSMELVCECPRYLLTPGAYSVTFGIVALGRGTLDFTREKRLAFQIEDNETLLSTYGVKYPGVTAVPSKWSEFPFVPTKARRSSHPLP